EAEVKFLDGDFRVQRPGAYVRCAVTGIAIPLEELKYWSVERQEAYANPDAVLKRLYPPRAVWGTQRASGLAEPVTRADKASTTSKRSNVTLTIRPRPSV